MSSSTGNIQNVHEHTQDGGFEFNPTRRAGARLLNNERSSLISSSTTYFTVVVLGPLILTDRELDGCRDSYDTGICWGGAAEDW